MCLLLCLSLTGYLFCQDQGKSGSSILTDSVHSPAGEFSDTTLILPETMEVVMEDYISRTDADFDFADIFDGYNLSRQTVNINKAPIRVLKRLALNDIQIANLKGYIKQYGEITGIYELHLVEGFDSALIIRLKPHLEFRMDPELHKITANNLRMSGRHTILSRISRTLERSAGYYGITDSLATAFAGNPDKLLFRYSFNYYDRLKIGVTMEKDPGEDMKSGFDFYSFNFLFKSKKLVKTIALGNYNVTFGQGLTMNSGFSYATNPSTGVIQTKTNRLSSSTGANENSALRGGALILNPIRNIDLTMFYSIRKIDANICMSGPDEKGDRYFTSILKSGLHRTAQEIESKDAVGQEVYGGNIQYKTGGLHIGGTMLSTAFSLPMKADDQPYKKYSFSGKNLINYGTDISLSTGWIKITGEYSTDSKGGSAWQAGINSYSTDNFGLSLFYRNYSPNYHNFFSNTYSVGSTCVNETGFYAGFFMKVSRNFILTVSADHFRHPWFKYRIDAPSTGCEYNLQFRYELSEKELYSIRYVYNRKQVSTLSDEEIVDEPINGNTFFLSEEQANTSPTIDHLVDISKHTIRLNFQYSPLKSLMLRNRLDILLNKSINYKASGYLLYQDIIYSLPFQSSAINLRYALFDTDSYNERIYTYESDVLYSFSVPSYYYKGSRIYLMLNYDFSRNISLWLRYSQSFYTNKASMGTRFDEIMGNTKSEIKVQLLLKI